MKISDEKFSLLCSKNVAIRENYLLVSLIISDAFPERKTIFDFIYILFNIFYLLCYTKLEGSDEYED